MELQPEEQAWQTYVNFELRYKEIDRARTIYVRDAWFLIHSARRVYERAVEFFRDDFIDERLFIGFARFEEEGQKEHNCAKKTKELYKAYTIHEKKYGDRASIEDVIVSKRKFQYEQEVASNPQNYDAWFDYLRLIEGECDCKITPETYERAIANVPPCNEKNYWRRYIYLTCLELIPHKKFTFNKIWLLYAQFEIRCKDLNKARKTLDMAIGMCRRDKLFRGYIQLEIQLREFDRFRLLYEIFLEYRPENCVT
uniref:Suppressor of forked domain-containing protein n=1 Tax=Glossina brevipalpis TaxID=37001 RepID=A0A1A9WLB2_9MUSC